MSGLFRKQRKNEADGGDDDAIPEEILNSIPDLEDADEAGTYEADAPEPEPAPLAAPAPAPAPAPRRAKESSQRQAQKEAGKEWGPMLEVPPQAKEVHQLLSHVRREMESVFLKELDRVEASFSSLVTQMESRLRAANGQLNQLEAERTALEQANVQYQRKFQALRAITEDE